MPRTDEDVLLTLYKYRSLSGVYGRPAAVDIVRNSRLYWQSPLAFNDPFDCNPVMAFGYSASAREAFVDRVISTHMNSAPRSARRRKKRELRAVGPSKHESDMKQSFREWMTESAVTCFSDVKDSILMWAHYADSHRGVCFIFREIIKPQPWIAMDVVYSSERHPVDMTELAVVQNFERSVLHKAIDWQYEREKRMIDYRKPPGPRSFPREALIGAIYGDRISDDDRAFMDDLLVSRPDLKRYNAKIDDRFFRVNVSPAQ